MNEVAISDPEVTTLSATAGPTTTTVLSTPTTPSRALSGPEITVLSYFDAVNRRDYSTAWALGGRNLDTDFDHFTQGFSTTGHVRVTIVGVDGNQVHSTLDALQTDGSRKRFTGFYEVREGVIVTARISEV